MKAYIVGVNLNKYTILNRISGYFSGEGIEVEEVNWLSRKNISLEDISNGDIYIWVEIDALISSKLSMIINHGDDKNVIVNNFSLLLKDIKKNKITNVINESKEPNKQDDEYPVLVANKDKKSSLCGINVVIENKEYYISKDDYEELYKLDEMLSKHGYKISSIAVEE